MSTDSDVGDFEKAFDEAEDRVSLEDQLYEAQNALRETRAKLTKTQKKTEELVEAVFQGAYEAAMVAGRPKIKPYASPKFAPKSLAKEEMALFDTGDWQYAKTSPSYNSEVARERVNRFITKGLKIVEMHRLTVPVRECHLLLGGDMLEGLFQFPSQPFEIDSSIFDQYVGVATLLDEIVRRLAQAFDKVYVHAEEGNHGRIGSKRDAIPKHDNLDRMAYKLAEALGKDIPNSVWYSSDEDIKQVEIGNYRALLLHGDEIGRGGFASPMTIVRHADRWKSGAWPWDFKDVYIHHHHQHQEWNMANGNGSVYMTGSTESDNRYARDGMAAAARPSQRLHFIDPRAGQVTAQYKVWVDKD